MSIDPISHRPILPYGPGGLAGAHAAPPHDGARFARVFDIADARAAREPIPDEVREDMARAADLVDSLAAKGQRVAFDVHQLSGELVASLVDEHAAEIKRVSLVDVIAGLDP